jgi:uncharacterized membrane protein YhaH (DUF805 family)
MAIIKKPTMGFSESIETCLKKYITFSGRARRSEYWLFWLFYIPVFIVLYILENLLFHILYSPIYHEYSLSNEVILLIPSVIFLLLFIPSLAAEARRFHDIGYSGYWVLLTPLANALCKSSSDLLEIIGIIIGIASIVLLCQDSQPATNAYGPSPKYVNEGDENNQKGMPRSDEAVIEN